MQNTCSVNRYIVARDKNVVCVNFGRRDPDPPAPTFPGAGALRQYPGSDSADPGCVWLAARPETARAAFGSIPNERRTRPRLSPL